MVKIFVLQEFIADAELKSWPNPVSFLLVQRIAVVEFDSCSTSDPKCQSKSTSNSCVI